MKVRLIRSKYKYTPNDIVKFIVRKDLQRSQQKSIIEDLFKNYNKDIAFIYRNDFMIFKREIDYKVKMYEVEDTELSEVELILKEFNLSSEIMDNCETDYFGDYFKLIKLDLIYSGITYRKMKLRTLINEFGYKKRTYDLVDKIIRQ
jgi:hypothetical protein